MNNLWFTADTHFGHKNIIKFCDRPCNSLLEMDNLIIDNWNAVVGQNDEVWHLGDVAWRDIELYLPRLNGRINVTLGNHDHTKQVRDRIARNITGNVFEFKELKVDNKSISLFHYPIEQWNKKRYGAWHLHGHCHGTLENTIPNRMDVGIDCHSEFRPFHYDEVKQLLGECG